MKRFNKFAILISILLLCIYTLTGCQSTSKNESYLNTSAIEFSQLEFDNTTNKTKVIWATKLTNNTIYNFNSFSVTFKLFNNSTLVDTQTYNYNLSVRHGGDYAGRFNFYVTGEVDSIEYVSWTAHYDTFWNTYKIWFIVMIVLISLASLIYLIIMITQDLEIQDTFDAIVDFFDDHEWTIAFIVPLAGIIWGIAKSYWVPVLIVLGGIITFVLIILLAHLISFIIKCIVDNIYFGDCFSYFGDCFSRRSRDDIEENEDYFDSSFENIKNYIDDKQKLSSFSVKQRNNGLHGYASLNKAEIIDLITSSNTDAKIDSQSSKQTKKMVTQSNTAKRIIFDDIAGLEDAKQSFKEKIVFAFEHKKLYEKYGKKVGGGILLYGLPGTGKTMFAEAASNETDALFIPIKCSDIKSKWYGESEANVKKIFEKARKAKKTIIFFDEFEAIGAKRTDNSDNCNNDLVPQILAEMQGVNSVNANSIIIVIAATNKPWAIDSAFLRPGRFDEKIYIPLPDFIARKRLFELNLQSIPQKNLNYDYLAEITEEFNGADIVAFCDKLKMLAINRSIANNTESPITMDDVEKVKCTIKSSVSSEDVDKLLKFKETYK